MDPLQWRCRFTLDEPKYLAAGRRGRERRERERETEGGREGDKERERERDQC